MTGRFVSILGIAALIVSAQIVIPGNVSAQAESAPSTENQGDQFVDNDGDGYNDNAPAGESGDVTNNQDADAETSGSGPQARKGRRFIDEDGDGISDFTQGLKRKNAPGNAGAGQDKSGNNSESVGPEGKGIQNALQNGLKTGQTREKGNGLLNALERGRKVGQSGPTDLGIVKDNTNTGVSNDTKNRFGREYLNNNKNFNAGNKGSNEDKGKDSGTKK